MAGAIIRAARPDDLKAINDIFNYYVERSTCAFQTEPGTLAERAEWFAAHDAAHPVIVADQSGEVVGWAALSRFHPRAAYEHSVEPSVYVRQDMLAKGTGRALLAELIERGRAAGHHTIVALICQENTGSLVLFGKFGFTEVAHLREVGRKFGRWLDVIYLQLML